MPWLKQIENATPTNYKIKKGEDNPPNAFLTLEYVYGYRCHDARNNLKFTANGKKVVYHAAAVGIVLDPDNNT